eukprot:1789359-Prorocentrum_lima.AAC.1
MPEPQRSPVPNRPTPLVPKPTLPTAPPDTHTHLRRAPNVDTHRPPRLVPEGTPEPQWFHERAAMKGAEAIARLQEAHIR